MCSRVKNNHCCNPCFVPNNNNRIFAAGNIAVSADIVTPTIFDGVLVTQGSNLPNTYGTLTLTAPSGYRFITVQAVAILSNNSAPPAVAIISTSPIASNLGSSVILDYPGTNPNTIGVSVLAYLVGC